MAVTAAVLSGREIEVRATCNSPCERIQTSPTELVMLPKGDMALRTVLFALHAERLPTFFARLSSKILESLDGRLAVWPLNHRLSGEGTAIHGEIARGLMTARQRVTGRIVRRLGLIRLHGPAALARFAKETFSVCADAMPGRAGPARV